MVVDDSADSIAEDDDVVVAVDWALVCRSHLFEFDALLPTVVFAESILTNMYSI